MNDLTPPQPPSSEAGPALAAPHVAVAPGVLDRDHVVVRADDDTDAEYAARVRLLAMALAFARGG
jgi:hypothetical protein